MNQKDESLRKNPSRETCEGIIRRILMTELLQKGKNRHFRSAADFMSYFESLYPASDALTKQVQRAVKALSMPKDDLGYFIPNKTTEQLEHEKDLAYLFRKADAAICTMEDCQSLLLKTGPSIKSYLLHMIRHSPLFENKFETLLEVSEGILFYTRDVHELKGTLETLIVR